MRLGVIDSLLENVDFNSSRRSPTTPGRETSSSDDLGVNLPVPLQVQDEFPRLQSGWDG